MDDSVQPDSSRQTLTADAPISVRDVLRAVFLPPRDVEPAQPGAPAGFTWPVLRVHLPAGSSRAASADTVELFSAPAVNYTEHPIPQVRRDTTRIAAVGMGVPVALLVVYMAQTSLAQSTGGFTAALLYVLAGAVWLGLLLFEFALPDGGLLKRGPQVSGGLGFPLNLADWPRTLGERGFLMVAALALSAATYFLTANNLFTAPGVITWLASIAAWLLVVSHRAPLELLRDWRAALRASPAAIRRAFALKPLPVIAFVVIMAAAVFFRTFRLDSVPLEMTSDHVEKLLDAYDVSQGIFHVFFTRNGGREAIQFYLVALAGDLFGTGSSFLTLKLVSVIEALALFPLIILLGRETVDRETGFLAAALLAVAWWHTSLARLALRIALTPLILTALLIVLVRGVRTGSRRAWVWAGIWMGIGVYAYQALRVAPLLAITAAGVSVAGLVVRAIRAHLRAEPEAPAYREAVSNALARQAVNLAVAGVVALAMFVPMLRVWRDYPDELWRRVVNRTTSSEVAIEDSPVSVFADNYRNALLMFNRRGDIAWISAMPGKPMLDLIAGGLLVLGVVAWLVRLRLRRDPADALILLAGLIMLLPSALAIAFPIENPSATRASGTIPIVFVLAAWPLALIRQRWSAVLGRLPGTLLAGALIVTLIGGSAFLSYNTYFVEYDRSYRLSALNPAEVADAVREVIGPDASLDGVWLQGWPYWHDFRAIGIEAGDITFDNAIVDVPTLQSLLIYNPDQFAVRPLVFIVHPADIEALGALYDTFPSGTERLYTGRTEGHEFKLFVVPPN
jgi:hypothetical protein